MFIREKVNVEELKSTTLKILSDKIEYNQDFNEIWQFGFTEKNQTVLIRVKQFNNVFFIYTQDKLENNNKTDDIKQLIQEVFKKNEIEVKEFKNETLLYYKIEILNGSYTEQQLQDHLNKLDLEKLNLADKAQFFIPKIANQFSISLRINPKTFLSFEVDGNQNSIIENNKISTCQIEIVSNQFKPKISFDNTLYKQISDNQIILITDLENLVIENGFDANSSQKNPIFMISNIIFKNGQKQSNKQIFTTSETMELDPSVQIKYFKSELQMLQAWFDELNIIDPDVITGFNVLKFDLSFLFLRTKYLIEQEKSDYKTINFGRIPSIKLEYKIIADFFCCKNYFFLKEDINILEACGRQVIDNSWYFNHTHAYIPSHQRRLKDWAFRYLDDDSQKLEIMYNEFPEYLFSKDIKKRSLLGEYNIRDNQIVHDFFLMFNIFEYYKEMGFLNSILTQDYHNKSLTPLYFNQLIKSSQNPLNFQNDVLVIQSNQQDDWNKLQTQIQHLQKLQKVKFIINEDTSPLIFKQIIILQDKLKVENITLKFSNGVNNLPFRLSSLLANLDQNTTKVLNLHLNSDFDDSEFDFIESFTNLPPSLSSLYVKLNNKVKLINYEKNINFKANQISKIAFDFNQFQSSNQDFLKFLNKFLSTQQNLSKVDLIFSYDKTNSEFIKDVIRVFSSSCKQLKILNLTIQGNDQTKNSNQKADNDNQKYLFENILSILEQNLLCIQLIFFNYVQIKLSSLNNNIFSTFASKQPNLKLFILKIDEEKTLLKNKFYEMVKSLKKRQ
ncbi:DNA polymerase family B exonuclease domain protein (macronuclear) [Tetrahymena thermophila SB210]|uniref:DNA polymerase delta catalytic subunit n=1 Tax=Tetrahymena thermophila (strain SB210) TaxID=312017 RepID=I7M9Z1_TETTS|nr:DNA polymerase family B exonuclease domain protein [Tetrahymena thermophila SB210]EAS03084.2 DNA polymerase family B exonuclease domain protein [Tetrahymena thermophila SB210]|eukprot:XP_001023329.2 DNA polymerase family B exonuclease domain protein [Tetrahymena thermophila SB210]